MNKKKAGLYSLLGLVILLVVWEIGVDLLSIKLLVAKQLAPYPTIINLLQLLQENSLTFHILSSLKRVFVGLWLALIIAVPVGLWIGLKPKAELITSGVFQLLRMISPLSWMPIVVMIFGIGDKAIYFLLCFAAIWPIMFNTATGIKAINPNWILLGLSLSMTKWQMLFKIILPAITGSILTGLRLAIGIVWIVLVPAEMLGVNDGLGYFILDTRDRMAYSELMAVILLIGLIGWFLDNLVRTVTRIWRHN